MTDPMQASNIKYAPTTRLYGTHLGLAEVLEDGHSVVADSLRVVPVGGVHIHPVLPPLIQVACVHQTQTYFALLWKSAFEDGWVEGLAPTASSRGASGAVRSERSPRQFAAYRFAARHQSPWGLRRQPGVKMVRNCSAAGSAWVEAEASLRRDAAVDRCERRAASARPARLIQFYQKCGRAIRAPHTRKLAVSHPCIAPAQALTATVGQVRESGPARNGFSRILNERHKWESVTIVVAAARAVADDRRSSVAKPTLLLRWFNSCS